MKTYHKAEKYDMDFVARNWMGPHPLWLLEELCENMDLRPGMRVLDMGCGKGLTSIFLAKEYGVTVFANDLWISATDNLRRFEEAGIADRVFPIRAEAHALPYAKDFFDVAISVDSYHYYGASESYFPDVFSSLVKSGGQFGIVIPGLSREFDKGYPDTLEKLWFSGLFTFHSSKWWRDLWGKTGLCEITSCYYFDDPKAIWQPWADWCIENFEKEFGDGGGGGDFDARFLEADTGNDIALIAMTAIKK